MQHRRGSVVGSGCGYLKRFDSGILEFRGVLQTQAINRLSTNGQIKLGFPIPTSFFGRGWFGLKERNQFGMSGIGTAEKFLNDLISKGGNIGSIVLWSL